MFTILIITASWNFSISFVIPSSHKACNTLLALGDWRFEIPKLNVSGWGSSGCHIFWGDVSVGAAVRCWRPQGVPASSSHVSSIWCSWPGSQLLTCCCSVGGLVVLLSLAGSAVVGMWNITSLLYWCTNKNKKCLAKSYQKLIWLHKTLRTGGVNTGLSPCLIQPFFLPMFTIFIEKLKWKKKPT